MGYSTRNNGQITDYWPDDDENTIHIPSDASSSLQYLIEIAKKKWGDDIELTDIKIESRLIHTRCIYYDSMDWGDYTDFIIMEKISND